MLKKTKKVFISVGEASGDLLGSKLMMAMRGKSAHITAEDHTGTNKPSYSSGMSACQATENYDIPIEFSGIGGYKMEELGIKSLFSMHELSVIGFLEVIPRIYNILKRLQQTVDFILESKPDMIITIDSPGFHFRLVKQLRKLNVKIPIIHYIAPTVWAYAPKRAQIVSNLYDHIILILPFEKQYFDAVDISSTFIGHPSLENAKQDKESAIHRGKKQSDVQISIMLGSRDGEIQRHLPEITKAVIELSKKYEKKLTVVFPTLQRFNYLIQNHFNDITDQLHGATILVTSSENTKNALIAHSDVAIVKSGTSVIELLKFDIPMVVIYKLSWLTAFILKHRLTIPHVALCNIVAGEKIVPELLQSDMNYKNIVAEIEILLNDENARAKQLAGYDKVKRLLRADHSPQASEIAAELVLSMLQI